MKNWWDDNVDLFTFLLVQLVVLAGLFALIIGALWVGKQILNDDRQDVEVSTTTSTIASQCVAPGWRAIPVPGGWTGIEDPRCK